MRRRRRRWQWRRRRRGYRHRRRRRRWWWRSSWRRRWCASWRWRRCSPWRWRSSSWQWRCSSWRWHWWRRQCRRWHQEEARRCVRRRTLVAVCGVLVVAVANHVRQSLRKTKGCCLCVLAVLFLCRFDEARLPKTWGVQKQIRYLVVTVAGRRPVAPLFWFGPNPLIVSEVSGPTAGSQRFLLPLSARVWFGNRV